MDSVGRLCAQWEAERPDLDLAPIALFGRLQRLGALLQRRCDTWLEPLGLTWEAFSLIVTLRRCGAPYALRPTDIYRASLLSSGAVTNRIDRVEAQGLVTRLRDPHDKRGVIVQLTASGLALADHAIELHCKALGEVLGAALPDEDRAALVPLLTKLLLGLEDEGGSLERNKQHL